MTEHINSAGKFRVQPIRFTPTVSNLRGFGLILSGALFAIGIWPMLFSRSPREAALAAAASLCLIGLALPRLLYWPYQIWMNLGTALGWINTRIIIGVLWYIVVTPSGLIKRLAGNDSLDLSSDSKATTYATACKPRDHKHFERQF